MAQMPLYVGRATVEHGAMRDGGAGHGGEDSTGSEGGPLQGDDQLEALPEDSRWQFVVEPGPTTRRRVEESWLCVADGVVGTRGSLEEGGHESMPLVLAAGVYGPDQTLLEAPSWVTLDGQALPPGRRVLDLRDGTVRRDAAADDTTKGIRSTRFACIARPGTGVLVAELTDTDEPLGEDPDTALAPTTEVEEQTSPLGGGIVTLTRTARRAQPAAGLLIERVAAHQVASRRRPRREDAERSLEEAWRLGARGLLAEQRAAWRRRWERADIEITGDPELTRAVRFCLFHLMSSVADAGAAAVGPRGLSGRAYAGHVMWDADVFVLPFFAATHPAGARAMLEYRIRRLAAARRAAAAQGRAGARFPWESAASGTDVTPPSGVDESGNEVPILTGQLEEHITADVAWAAWRLAAWRGRWTFLDGPGRDLVLDTARYWASRVRLDAEGVAHVDAVIGPDEYHEDVDDNAFTNNLAAWNLRRAAELVGRRPELGGAEEADAWATTADRLLTGYDPDTKVYEQFAGFGRLEPVLATSLSKVPFAGDLVLGRSRLGRSQLVKQADVLMLHHMVPEAVASGSLGANLDYYLPRTCHGSSLSPSVHAAVLARAGRVEEGRLLLELATAVDLDDLTGTAADGLHLANLGGIWQALVHGFAGLAVTGPDDPVLMIDPKVPAGWGELHIRLDWHGRALALRCSSSSLYVGTDQPLTVSAFDRTVSVEPPGRRIP